jgi:hypothetical protein
MWYFQRRRTGGADNFMAQSAFLIGGGMDLR